MGDVSTVSFFSRTVDIYIFNSQLFAEDENTVEMLNLSAPATHIRPATHVASELIGAAANSPLDVVQQAGRADAVQFGALAATAPGTSAARTYATASE